MKSPVSRTNSFILLRPAQCYKLLAFVGKSDLMKETRQNISKLKLI